MVDGSRGTVFERRDQPAPAAGRVTFEVGGGGPEGLIRRAAMIALTSVRGQEGPPQGPFDAFDAHFGAVCDGRHAGAGRWVGHG